MSLLSQAQIVETLRKLGLHSGDIVFIHSSLSSIGVVSGGANTVCDALLEVVGPEGTLVVPTFTFVHSKQTNPVFDPMNDPSEVGQITEAIRTRPGARRSHHLLHSVAALGARADEITSVQGAAAWAGDGPFWQLYELDAFILMLGVPYLRCTYFHLIEQHVHVPYRHFQEREARIRTPTGAAPPFPTLTFSPKPGFAGNDFNRLGVILEERGLTRVGPVGNAVARLFRASDALRVGVAEYRKDPLLFVITGGGYTPLQDGVLTGELYNEKSVLDPGLVYTQGR